MHSTTDLLLAYWDAQHSLLQGAFELVPSELRDRPPAPDRWSAANVVEHLAIVETRIATVLSQRIEEARPALPADTSTDNKILPTIDYQRVYDRSIRVKAPETAIPTGLDWASAWAGLENAGSMMRNLLVANDGLALSSVTHPHPRFGVLSVYQWVAFLGAHEVRHADQIREGNPLTARTAH